MNLLRIWNVGHDYQIVYIKVKSEFLYLVIILTKYMQSDHIFDLHDVFRSPILRNVIRKFITEILQKDIADLNVFGASRQHIFLHQKYLKSHE